MPRYRNVSGIAREVNKRYLNVDGVAREISKGYKNIDGIAREYFSNGVVWEKYDCMWSTEDFIIHENPSWGGTMLIPHGDFYEGYETSEHYGVEGVGESIYRDADGSQGDPTDAFDLYFIDEDVDLPNHIMDYEVYRVFEMTEYYGYIYFHGEFVVSARASIYFEPYSTSLGTVVTEDGAIPDNGTLIDGSPQDSYCVVQKSGKLYYYIKQ